MKKTLRLLLCLTGFALAGLEPYPVASPGNFKHFNTYGNAAAKRVRMEGHDSIRVTLGGLGTTTGGARVCKTRRRWLRLRYHNLQRRRRNGKFRRSPLGRTEKLVVLERCALAAVGDAALL